MLVIVPLAMVLGARAISWAAAQIKTWKTGDTLTADDLNATFAALNSPQTVVDNFNAAVGGGAAVKLGAVTAAAPGLPDRVTKRWGA